MTRVIIIALTVALGLATAAAQEGPSPAERQELQTAAKVENPAARIEALKKFITAHPDGPLTPVARQYLLYSLVEAKAPVADLLAAGDAAAAADPDVRAEVDNAIAAALAERGEQLDKAEELATRALAAVPAEVKERHANTQDTLGWVQLKRGETEKAVENLSAAAAVLASSQEVLYHLGAAYEKAGKPDQALEAYVKSVSVFLGRNNVAEAPLRALYQKQHGSLAGLDEKLAAAREASRHYVIFEATKWDKPAPAFELKDISGKAVKLDDFKGKLIVMDFWGSWCPPCRAELPKFQALYEKYKDNKNVAFLAMNWERPGEPEARMKAVTDFMAKNQYTFPVIIDHDRVAVEAYAIEGFPTVYLIDSKGQIRYRNLGYDEGIEQVIEAQLESMLK
jgi:thiol-disulfide isomerase/thioredoxin/Flp pilus assembly protein TadD